MQQCSSCDHMRTIRSFNLCCESSSLILGNSSAFAETANVQTGGKLAIKTKLMPASTISCLSAFSVSNLTTKFTCLLSSRNVPLYCCLNSCIQASTCSVETLLGRLSFKVFTLPWMETLTVGRQLYHWLNGTQYQAVSFSQIESERSDQGTSSGHWHDRHPEQTAR